MWFLHHRSMRLATEWRVATAHTHTIPTTKMVNWAAYVADDCQRQPARLGRISPPGLAAKYPSYPIRMEWVIRHVLRIHTWLHCQQRRLCALLFVLPLLSRQTTNTDPPALHTTNSHLWGYPSAAVHCYHRWLVRSYCLPSRPILWMNHCFAWAMDFCAPISLTWKWHSCVGCCYRCTLSLMWQLRRLLLTFLGWAGDRQEETIYFLFFFIIVMCFVWERYKQQF